jgi:potassium efflux system protein
MSRSTVILAVAIALFAVTSVAQESETAPPQPESVQEVPSASATEIATRADRIQGEMSIIRDALQATVDEVERVAETTEELGAELQEELQAVERSEIQSMRKTDLERLTQSLNRIKVNLKKWRDELQGRADYLDQQQQSNKQELDYFQTIATSVDSEDLPAAIIERSIRISAALTELRESLRERLNLVIRNLAEVSELGRLIQEYSQLIDASAAQRNQDLFSFEYPVIWKISLVEIHPLGGLRNEVQSRSDAAREYLKINAFESLVLFILLVVAITLTVFSGISKMLPPDSVGVRMNLLKRPFAVVFLLWVALGPEFLLPELPAGLITVRLLIMIIALWRLLPALLAVGERRLVPALLMLMGVVVLLELWPQEGLLIRLANVGVSLVGIILFYKLGRTLKVAEEGGALWFTVGRLLAWLAPPLLGIAVFALIAGAVSLGVQVSHGMLYLFGAILALMIVEMTLNTAVELFVTASGQQWLRFVRNNPQAVQRSVATIIRFFMLVLLVVFIPRLFPLTQITYDWITETLRAEFELGSVAFSLTSILVLFIGIYLAIAVSRFIRLLLNEDVFPRLPVAVGAASAATRLIYYCLVTGSILLVLAVSGVHLSSLTLLISALGVGIGFGLQGIVNNFVSGLVLAFEQPFQVGDIIAVGQLTGRVRQIGIRSSRVRTFEGAEVIVPNSTLIDGEVINWTLSDTMRRVEVNVGVAYGSDTTQVRNLLLKVAEDNEQVAGSPQPEALFLGFDDSDMKFNLRIWISEAGEWPQISSDLYEAVNLALNEAGIEIPFPQRTLHMNSPAE